MQRRATTAVALSFGLLGAPSALSAQSRGMTPAANTPRLLVAVFASSDRVSGVQAADAIRNRISTSVSVRQLYVIPRNDIVNYLESSGYKADSSLGVADLKELAKLLRADEVLYGTVTRGASGLRIEPRLLLANDTRYAQPLPPVDASNPNDAARNIERSFMDARKQIADHVACQNAIRDKQTTKAVASAQAGITKYPNATIARLCLANAFQEMKAPADSVLRVLNEVLAIDPKNSMALGFAYQAHKQKDDQENAVRALVKMLALEPNNPTLQGNVVTELALLGKPHVAIPIVDTLLMQNPGDPQLIRQKWLLTLGAVAAADSTARPGLIAQAITAGENMVRADTTLADSTYYSRMIVAAAAVPAQAAKGTELAARATQKFPRIAEFWALKATAERRAGQLQMAEQSVRQALAIDPKWPNGTLLLATINLEMNRLDTAVAIARRAVAAGEDPKTWGTFLLGPTRDLVTTAQRTDSLVYWERAYDLAKEADKMAPQLLTKFLVGVSSFQIGVNALQSASEASKAKRPNRSALCQYGRTAQDMFVVTQTNIMQGVMPDTRETVGRIMGVVQQYSPNVEQVVKEYCRQGQAQR